MCESCHNRDICGVCTCVCVYKLWKPPTVKAVSRRGRRETHTRAGEKHRVGERASGVTGE